MIMQRFIVICLALLTVACGWQLRDTMTFHTSIPSIYFSSSSEDNSLIRDLRRASDVYGVEPKKTRASAAYTVMVTDVRENVRIASINSGGRVAEYQLTEDVDFVIISTDNDAVETRGTASADKVYEFEENDILASANEQQRIRYEMKKQIVKQILTQVQNLANSSTSI